MLAVNEGFELIDFDALDSRCVEQWSRELRVGIRHLTWLAKRLDEQAKKCRHYKASA
jgi:hypothetical protein